MPHVPVIASPTIPSKIQISIAPPVPLTDDPFPLNQDIVLKATGKARSLIGELASGIVELAQKFEASASNLISNSQAVDAGLITLLSALVRQTSLINDAAGDNQSLVLIILDLQGGFGRLLVNLNQGRKNVGGKYELIDKSAQDVVSAWAAVKTKAQAAQLLFKGGDSGGSASSLFRPF